MSATCLACGGELSPAEVQFNVLVCGKCAGRASADRALREWHWELSRAARLAPGPALARLLDQTDAVEMAGRPGATSA